MIDPHQLHFCLVEIDKIAMPGALARAGIGAAAGAAVAGAAGAGKSVRALRDAGELRRQGAITPEVHDQLNHYILNRFAGHLLGGAAVGGAGGVALPHAAAAVKKYSGDAAQHLGREFGRGAAEHAAPAARAAMHEVAEAAPLVGRAAAAGAAGHASTIGENAARGAVRGAKDAVTPGWVGKLKEHAARLMREE